MVTCNMGCSSFMPRLSLVEWVVCTWLVISTPISGMLVYHIVVAVVVVVFVVVVIKVVIVLVVITCVSLQLHVVRVVLATCTPKYLCGHQASDPRTTVMWPHPARHTLGILCYHPSSADSITADHWRQPGVVCGSRRRPPPAASGWSSPCDVGYRDLQPLGCHMCV